MTLPYTYSAASDVSPYDLALRFRVRLSALLDANGYAGGELDWRTAFADGQVVQIPLDPDPAVQFYRYDFAANPRPLAALVADRAVPNAPLWNRGHVSVRQLWGHYNNAAFRQWQLDHGASRDHLVGSAGGAASPPLWLPYPASAPPVQAAIAPPRRGAAPAVVAPASNGLDLAMFSVYDALPAELRVTLQRSFDDRVAGAAGTDHNLDAAFDYGHTPPPPSLWDGLDRMSDTDLNGVVRVFERIVALRNALRVPDQTEMQTYSGAALGNTQDDRMNVGYNDAMRAFAGARAPDLWRHVRYVQHAWWGSSFGFGAVYDSTAGLETDLERNERTARDMTYGAAEHQATTFSRHNLTPLFSDADTHCWREVANPAGTLGLHFCVPTGAQTHANIHIDWMDPCFQRDVYGHASYALTESVGHLQNVWNNTGIPATPFVDFNERFDGRVAAFMRNVEAHPPISQPPLQTGLGTGYVTHSSMGNLTRRRREVEDGLRVMDFVTAVAIERRRWACQGQRGWELMEAAVRQLSALFVP